MANIDDVLLDPTNNIEIVWGEVADGDLGKLKQQLYADMLEIIGEDARFVEDIPAIDEMIKEELRLTQRQALAKYFGTKEEKESV